MKADTFMNAVGMIDERYLETDAPEKKITQSKWRRIISIAAAAVLLLCPLPTLTAYGVDSAYNVLYHIAPSVAQTFKPVRMTCEDKGIEMTVISAERIGSKASVYLAMRDTTGTCPDGAWDLFDSYNINVNRDMSGHCSFADYDADTHTAYFVVSMETMDGSNMPKGKVTFSVSDLLIGKVNTNTVLEAVDMSSIPYEPDTYVPDELRGQPMPEGLRFLTVPEQPVCTPVQGADIMNIGYIDGAFHVLAKYEDIHNTDDHGFITLIDSKGNIAVDEMHYEIYYYWDENHKDSYAEYVIPASYDSLTECKLKGEFVTCTNNVSGDWEITFPLR